MQKFTKIICTIGPSVSSLEKMIELIEKGMNVARINFSHGTYEEHRKTIDNVKKAREITGQPIAILLDTKGPEIRVGEIANNEIVLSPQQKLEIVPNIIGNDRQISIHPFDVLEKVNIGMKILFDDGYILTQVVEKKKDRIVIEVINQGVLRSKKGVNIPDAVLSLPAMTQKDIEDLKFGCQNDIDIVAASFVRSEEHVLSIKQLLSEQGRSDIPVIAKIENKEGIANFNNIVKVADGIMIARGDLGVEVDLSLVPRLQKMMTKKCIENFKPVVIATQMLESMIANPRPTRAESSDVANAIYDYASVVMLSGETAIGKYPVEALKQMCNIIDKTEEDIDYRAYFDVQKERDFFDISTSVGVASVKTAYSAEAKAIFVFTSSGFTPRLISRWRPAKHIIALTTNKRTYYQLSFLWGVIPLYIDQCKDAEEAFTIMSKYALENNIVSFGDLVVVTAGIPFGKRGSTSMMMVESIGHILVRGAKGYGEKVEGEIEIFRTKEGLSPSKGSGKIIVIPRCDDTFFPYMLLAKGIILENIVGDSRSEENVLQFAKKHNIPCIMRANNAMTLLSDNEKIVLDPQKALIYSDSKIKTEA
ncbi:MAG: pyruvate kinase [Parachlamydiales bacterium]|nr:pyruvate kinase [Parachlamydiales bacterium]